MQSQLGSAWGGRTAPEGLVYTGTCEVSLTRAVLPYVERMPPGPGGRVEDLGLGVVVDSTDASRAQVLDLGSGQFRRTELTGPLLLLGWLYPATLDRLVSKAMAAAGDDDRAGGGHPWPGGLALLGRTGFSALTRPLFLRVGFRDVVKDLDLHEELAIRVAFPGGVARAHLDYDDAVLWFQTGSTRRDTAFEEALISAFPGREVGRVYSGSGVGAWAYRVELEVPRSIETLRAEIGRLRGGFLRLLSRIEPARYEAVIEAMQGFGVRDSLAAFERPGGGSRIRTERVAPTRVDAASAGPGSESVH